MKTITQLRPYRAPFDARQPADLGPLPGNQPFLFCPVTCALVIQLDLATRLQETHALVVQLWGATR